MTNFVVNRTTKQEGGWSLTRSWDWSVQQLCIASKVLLGNQETAGALHVLR